MTVGIVVVSHSALLADGLVELCAQVAPDVSLVPAGGTDDGRLGTSFAKVADAIATADSGDGVVVVGDLGSALLTAESAVEFDPDDARRARTRVVDGPLVEGAVAAAVAAQSTEPLTAVAAAASGLDDRMPRAPDAAMTETAVRDAVPDAAAEVVLPNPDGLHARPAAALVKLAARFESALRVDGADARSLLAVIALGRRQGELVRVTASGPDAAAAVEAVRSLVAGGFGEGAIGRA